MILLDPHSGGLALARRMVGAGARVTVIAEPGNAWDAYSRGAGRLLAPFGGDGEPWVAALREMAGADEAAVVLPSTDRASALLARAARRLPATLRAFEGPDGGHMALMDKATADGIARRAGVSVPWTALVSGEVELANALAAAPWPCVVKPVFSHEWRGRYGEARTFLVADARAARRLLERPLGDGVRMLLCQYVPGGDDAVEEAILVRLADGSFPVGFGCHKLRQYPRGFGATALGESSPLPETMEIARRVLAEAGFVGVAGVEVKRDAATGRRWFLEANVRMPGQWGLGDACGVDASRRLVAVLSGRALGAQEPLRAGVRLVVPELDVRVLREVLREAPVRRRPVAAARFLRPWVGAGEIGLLDARDPAPGLAWIGVLVWRRVRRILARARGA